MNSIFNQSRALAVAACGLALVACDSIQNVSEDDYAALPPEQVLLGGTITGLGNSPVVLQNNGAGNRSFSTTSQLTMGSVPVGSAYNITVLTQPQNRTCTVVNGSGTITAPVSNVQVNCVLNAGVNAYTISGTVSGGAVGTAGLKVMLATLDGNQTVTVPAGETTFSFPTPVVHLNNYTVTATYPGTGAVPNNCGVAGGTGTVNGANVTNVNVNACMFTIGATVGGANPFLPFTLGAGGVTVGLFDASGTQIQTGSTTVATTPIAFATPRASNASAFYSAQVITQPTGQYCVLRNGGTASLVTPANVTLSVACNASPTAPNTLTGTYRAGTARTYLSLMPNGTFLYGIHASTAASSGVEHGFYSVSPGSVLFMVMTDTNGAGGLSNASADFGFANATAVNKTAGPPATLNFTLAGTPRAFTAVPSTAGKLNGAWTGAEQMFVYDVTDGTAFHMGANGVGALQDICLIVSDPQATSGNYIQDRNAQCRPGALAVLDTAPTWFRRALPGAPITPQRASDPTNFTLTAGTTDSLSLQPTYDGAPLGSAIPFSRNLPN